MDVPRPNRNGSVDPKMFKKSPDKENPSCALDLGS
jgi:hypothetical protein